MVTSVFPKVYLCSSCVPVSQIITFLAFQKPFSPNYESNSQSHLSECCVICLDKRNEVSKSKNDTYCYCYILFWNKSSFKLMFCNKNYCKIGCPSNFQ